VDGVEQEALICLGDSGRAERIAVVKSISTGRISATVSGTLASN
jgi:hypothetical protein